MEADTLTPSSAILRCDWVIDAAERLRGSNETQASPIQATEGAMASSSLAASVHVLEYVYLCRFVVHILRHV